MKTFFAAVVLVALVAAASACQPPNCDHVDYGTCGNACCNVSFVADINTDNAAKVLLDTLSKGGPDGRYRLSMTAEGTLGFADFTGYGLGVNYLGQAIHSTKVHHYNDTINISIAPMNSNTSSLVTAFSISQIAGAYGDGGQNFKNIISIFQASGVQWKYTIVAGCPAPANAEPIARLHPMETAPVVNAAPVAAAEEPQPMDLHASCKLSWTIKSSCSAASSALASAAKTMTGFSDCVGEKCGYTLESANATYLQAYHETPVHHYRDDISITFAASGSSCVAHAYSTSTIWYAVLDDGTNYCNLHNLIEATTLTFTEDVDTSDCTQYSTANCAKY